jgi:phage-related protein (TIGR01555 family)
MFWRTKPKEETPAPAPVARNSSFSTEGSVPGVTALDRQIAIARHFQRPAGSAGTAMDSATGTAVDFKQPQFGAPDAQFMWYASQGFIGYQVAAVMAQHWLVDRCCLMPARDAVRVGYDVSLPDEHERADDIIKAFKKADKRHNINATMREYVHMGRIFGVRVAIFRVRSSDPDYYAKPFNPDGVTPGSYMGISQVDPIWITPELTDAAIQDPANIRFYEPEFYSIGGTRYHRSHLCVYIPFPVPDSLKPSYQYAGKSLPQLIYERVYASERTANEGPQLAMTKRLVVMKTDADAFWSNITSSLKRLFDWTRNRDNYGVMTVDKDSEDIVQHDTGLAELDTVIMTQYQLVAAIAEVPATKLLQTQPKGFASTGEYEAESYRQTLEGIQVNDLEPLLERHHLLTWLSEVKPRLGIAEDVETEISWRPLDSPTALEWADLNLKKAQTAQIYAQLGAVDGEVIAQQLRNDKNSDFFGMEADEIELDLNDDPEAEVNQEAQ